EHQHALPLAGQGGGQVGAEEGFPHAALATGHGQGTGQPRGRCGGDSGAGLGRGKCGHGHWVFVGTSSAIPEPTSASNCPKPDNKRFFSSALTTVMVGITRQVWFRPCVLAR